jgi:hypothetical protein
LISFGCFHFSDFSIHIHLRKHGGWCPGILQLVQIITGAGAQLQGFQNDIALSYNIPCLILSALLVGKRFDSLCVKKYNLRHSATDNQWDRVISRVIGDFHSPAIDVSNISPTSALANFDKVATETGSRFHHRCNTSSSTNEFICMPKNSFTGLEPNNPFVEANILKWGAVSFAPITMQLSMTNFSPNFVYHGLRVGVIDS